MISCPAEAGRAGRHDGSALYRPGVNRQEALREAQRFPQLRQASEMSRRVYALGFLEGYDAAAQAAHSEQMKEQS